MKKLWKELSIELSILYQKQGKKEFYQTKIS